MTPAKLLPANYRRAVRAFAWVLQVLVLALTTQLSGAPIVAVEAGFAVEVDGCRDCPLDSDGEECPAGCPICHCVHGPIVSLPAPPPVLETAFVSSDTRTSEPPEASAPHAPFLSSLYRPPRAIRA